MISKFRIIRGKKGIIVEVQSFYWTLFGIKFKWVPYVKTSGLDECWNHSNEYQALESLLNQVKNEL